jgi:hypothetical protein
MRALDAESLTSQDRAVIGVNGGNRWAVVTLSEALDRPFVGLEVARAREGE